MKIGVITLTDTDTALDLAKALCEAGQTVSLYLSEKSCLETAAPIERYIEGLYQKNIIPANCRVNHYKWPRMRNPFSIAMARKIYRDMLEDGIEVVHILYGPSEPWLAVLANIIRKIPVVSTIIVPKPNLGEDLSSWVEPLNGLLVRGSDMIIVNGENLVEPVRKEYGIPADRIVYIPLGARTTTVLSVNKGVTEQAGTILFFGRANPHKGLEYLVRAQPYITRQVPYAKIMIVARGAELPRCRALMQDKGAFEIVEGLVPEDVMADYFARTSVVALPYLSASTSGVLLTAYGFGKPVVATTVGCLPEYVEDGVTGFLVPPANVELFADAVIRLLQDDDLRRQMGDHAKQWIEKENIQNVYRTIEVYKKVLSDNHLNSRG